MNRPKRACVPVATQASRETQYERRIAQLCSTLRKVRLAAESLHGDASPSDMRERAKGIVAAIDMALERTS